MSSDRLGMVSDVEHGLANAPDTPNLPPIEGLEGHGAVDDGEVVVVDRGRRVDAHMSHTRETRRAHCLPATHFGPSWSVRHLAAPHSMGPAVFPGSPPTHNAYLVPPGVCGSRPLLAVWDPRFSWAHRQPTTRIWSLLECAAPGRSSQYGTRGFHGLTANPQRVFGPSWSVRLLAAPHSMGPAVSTHRETVDKLPRLGKEHEDEMDTRCRKRPRLPMVPNHSSEYSSTSSPTRGKSSGLPSISNQKIKEKIRETKVRVMTQYDCVSYVVNRFLEPICAERASVDDQNRYYT